MCDGCTDVFQHHETGRLAEENGKTMIPLPGEKMHMPLENNPGEIISRRPIMGSAPLAHYYYPRTRP